MCIVKAYFFPFMNVYFKKKDKNMVKYLTYFALLIASRRPGLSSPWISLTWIGFEEPSTPLNKRTFGIPVISYLSASLQLN